MGRSTLLSLLFLGLFPLFLEAQQADPSLTVRILAEEPAEAEFSADDLEDAATVLLTSKAPDVRVTDDASLWLYLVPTCQSIRGGYSCSLYLSFHLDLLAWGPPFEELPKLVLWETSGVLTGPPDQSFRNVREALDKYLNEPIAAWRRLGEAERQCWISFLNNPFSDLTVRETNLSDQEGKMRANEFFALGPCDSE